MADNPRPTSADIVRRVGVLSEFSAFFLSHYSHQYNAVRHELTKLQQDAMAREASLKGEISSLREELEQAQMRTEWLDTHASSLQEELTQLRAQNAQLIRSLPSRDARYTHALKVIKDLLAERVRSILSLFFPWIQ